METRTNQAKGRQAKTDYSYGHAVEMELPDWPVGNSAVTYQDEPIPPREARRIAANAA